ncbi:MAG: hypothetical protein SGPRY_003461, partial [Prymnesium sp.]
MADSQDVDALLSELDGLLTEASLTADGPSRPLPHPPLLPACAPLYVRRASSSVLDDLRGPDTSTTDDIDRLLADVYSSSPSRD